MKLYEKETVTCQEMKQLEQAGDASGVSYYQMMENAGSGAARIILAAHDENPGCAAVFCGKGNNGGDGLVVARKLQEAGWEVLVVLVEGEPVTEDAALNRKKLPEKVKVVSLDNLEEAEAADVYIDSVYGTGFHGTLREKGKRAIAFINSGRTKGKKIYALDIPSGLPGDLAEEEPVGESVMADCTITFHAKKPVHDRKTLQDVLGRVIVCDIGIGEAIRRKEGEQNESDHR